MSFHRALLAVAALSVVAAGIVSAQGSVTDAARRRYEQATRSTDIEGVSRSLESDDVNERLEGLRDLTSLDDEKGIDLLLQALGDEDLRVRAKAIDSCGDLRATAATPVLIQQLFMRDTPEPVKRRILASLGKIGDPSSVKPIMDLLVQDLDTATRGTAIYALGDLGDAQSLALLDDMSSKEDDQTLRRLARQAATKVRHSQTVRASEANQPLNTFLNPQP